MLLEDLLSDLSTLDSELPVLLVSRGSAGHGLTENEAKATPFGEVLIDESVSESDIRPSAPGAGLNVGDVQNLIHQHSHAARYVLNGIIDEVLLPDGRKVRSTLPVLEVLGTENSALLLLGSPEDWPTVEFQ